MRAEIPNVHTGFGFLRSVRPTPVQPDREAQKETFDLIARE